jgi:hypothetical protein
MVSHKSLLVRYFAKPVTLRSSRPISTGVMGHGEVARSAKRRTHDTRVNGVKSRQMQPRRSFLRCDLGDPRKRQAARLANGLTTREACYEILCAVEVEERYQDASAHARLR